MKKILFVMNGMNIGGAERALLGLLSSIDYSKYKVDLFLLRRSGELLNHIDKRVNILPQHSKYNIYACPLKKLIKKGNFAAAIGRTRAKILAKKFNRKNCYGSVSAVELEYSHKYTVKNLPMINPDTTYDLAVSFITPHYIVAQKVNAKNKIAWIHTDYTQLKIDVESELEMWKAYDRVISISDTVTKGFLTKFPQLENKISVIEHVIPADFIKSQTESIEMYTAEESMPYKDGVINLLSIGRFCYAKNFDNVPEMCKIIRELGANVKWYLIGFGHDEDLIREKIAEFDMQDHVIILGKKANPYPYLEKCDYYVQPSRYEGSAVTVCEALVMKKKVIVANYLTAESQIKDGVDGVIVPQETKECAEAIYDFLNNSSLQHIIENNVANNDYTNKKQVLNLYQLISRK